MLSVFLSCSGTYFLRQGLTEPGVPQLAPVAATKLQGSARVSAPTVLGLQMARDFLHGS